VSSFRAECAKYSYASALYGGLRWSGTHTP
jgi:hypothetical protein